MRRALLGAIALPRMLAQIETDLAAGDRPKLPAK
jgi:hypothetical protein